MIFTFIQSQGGAYENRAQIFFDQIENVESISLSGTIKDAVNQLFIDLDALGFIDLTDDTGASDRILVCYPFVGGQAGSHKYNMLRPTDTDADFRITFSGGWTHTSAGAEANGTNGYGITHLQASSEITNTDYHISFRNSINRGNALTMDLGVYENPKALYFASKFTTDIILYADTSTDTTTSNSNSTGFYIATRTVSTHRRAYKDGSEVINVASTAAALPAYDLSIACLQNQTTSQWFTNGKYSIITIGDGLSSTEAANLHTAQSTFNTALSR